MEEGITVDEQPTISSSSCVLMIALQPSLLSYTGFAGSTSIDARDGQPEKRSPFMEVREEGMLTEEREVHPRKAS